MFLFFFFFVFSDPWALAPLGGFPVPAQEAPTIGGPHPGGLRWVPKRSEVFLVVFPWPGPRYNGRPTTLSVRGSAKDSIFPGKRPAPG